MAPEITRFNKVVFTDPTSVEGFRRAMDQWQNLWKAQATVALPFSLGFHARNMTGNFFNNYIAGGIGVKHYIESKRLQKQMKLAQEHMAKTPRHTLPDSASRIELTSSPTAAPKTVSEAGPLPRPLGPREFDGKPFAGPGRDFTAPIGPQVPNEIPRPSGIGERQFRNQSDQVFVESLENVRSGLDLTEGDLDRVVDSLTNNSANPGVRAQAERNFLDRLPQIEGMTDEQFATNMDRIAPRNSGTVFEPAGQLPSSPRRTRRERVGRQLSDPVEEITEEVAPKLESIGDVRDRLGRSKPASDTPSSIFDGHEFEDALKAIGTSKADIEMILRMRDNGVVTSGFFRTDLHEDAMAGISSSERKGVLAGSHPSTPS